VFDGQGQDGLAKDTKGRAPSQPTENEKIEVIYRPIETGQAQTFVCTRTGHGHNACKPESICILDDHASVRQSIVHLLDSCQLKARSFEDPEDFLADASKHTVDLAVLDVRMPKMNGLEVQARLREMSPETKVIVMSANGVPEMRAAALKAGAITFLEKPFDAELFLFLARQVLSPVVP